MNEWKLTFLVLKFLLPERFLSGAGELLCGGLESSAWKAMVSGSIALEISPSGESLDMGSIDSVGEPGAKSEQVLMVRARRRCWPMCVRFLEKLFLFLEDLTFACFSPGSSLTSRSGCDEDSQVFRLIKAIQIADIYWFHQNPIRYFSFFLNATENKLFWGKHRLARVSRTDATLKTRFGTQHSKETAHCCSRSVLTCMRVGESSVSGVAGGSSLMSLRPPISDLQPPIRSRACSLRFSLFSMRAKACRMASIFLSSRVCRGLVVGVGGKGGEEEGAYALVH